MKAEAAKLQGAGIPAKPCPMERVEWRGVPRKSQWAFAENGKTKLTLGRRIPTRPGDGWIRSPRSGGIASGNRLRCGWE